MKKMETVTDKKLEPCGRVISVNGRIGQAEFVPTVKVGDYIYYKTENKRVLCQITAMSTQPLKGAHGKFDIVNYTATLPKTWENLYKAQVRMTGQIEIGITEGTIPVKVRLNPFFRHILVGGKTGKGKTHVQIKIQEELLKLHVPSLVLDAQGEFIHLPEFSEDAVVVEEIRIDDLLSHLKFKHTVVLNLAGLPNKSKAQRCAEILSLLYTAKENDYKQAEGDKKLLQTPPLIVNIDEAEIFAPENRNTILARDSLEAVSNLAKRGGKIGISLIVNSQRLPALHYDVRSQCGSAIIFQITDSGSRTVLSQMPYITLLDLKRIQSIPKGTCLITGDLVDHPLIVQVSDISTPRAKDLDFETQLGLKAMPVIDVEEAEPFTLVLNDAKSLTYDILAEQYPMREVPNYPQMGKCVIVPEHHFKPDWKQTLEIQGCRVLYCPNMPGGSCYLVSQNGRGRMRTPIISETTQIWNGPCKICGLPKSKCICRKLHLPSS